MSPMDEVTFRTGKHPDGSPIEHAADVAELTRLREQISSASRTIELLRKVAETARAVIARHDWDAAIPGTPIYDLRTALMNAGQIAPVEHVKDAKPLILYFANDEDRAGFVELTKGAFRNPVEMDVP